MRVNIAALCRVHLAICQRCREQTTEHGYAGCGVLGEQCSGKGGQSSVQSWMWGRAR